MRPVKQEVWHNVEYSIRLKIIDQAESSVISKTSKALDADDLNWIEPRIEWPLKGAIRNPGRKNLPFVSYWV